MPRVLIPLAPGFEELEAITIIDLLRRAQIEVVSAGLAAGPVTASRGTVVVPDTTLDAVLSQSFDLIVLPGGQPGSNHLEADARVQRLLQQQHAAHKTIAAICAAPKVLASAGLLDGRHATCYPGAIDMAKFPSVHLDNRAVVRDGDLITSRGPGTAMDFALELIRVLKGPEASAAVEQGLVRPGEHASTRLAEW
jgi:4-methyl-5(b-hydroxyethyl)-thiazole monophosphate biosynthesis